jgi:hypothetical protein
MNEPKTTREPWISHERTVLLAVALVVALPLGWLAINVYTVRHRSAMHARIVASGGNFAADPNPFADDQTLPWIRLLLGDQPLMRLSSIASSLPPIAKLLKRFLRQRLGQFPDTCHHPLRPLPRKPAAS